MSGIHRAVQKAEREGLLTRTRAAEDPGGPSIAVEEPPVAHSDSAAAAVGGELPAWDAGAGTELRLSPLFVAATEPGSAAAEQYRLLRTRLEVRDGARRMQLLLVTSPRNGDGKTTTSANLALTMSQEFQHNVLLVEADLRRPMVAELFGVREEPGLVDVLVGTATLEEALVPVPGHRLLVLPAGLPAARSTELLASSMMQRVVDALRGRFDRIVVDTPPVTLADTHVLARLADGVLIVVRAGVTPRAAVERALAGADRQKLLGIVLNEVEEPPDEYAYAEPPSRESGD